MSYLKKLWQNDDAAFFRMLKNSGWLLGASGIGLGLGLVQGVLVARILGVEQYGLLGLIMTFVHVINRLTSFRMKEFVVKFTTDALNAEQAERAAAIIKLALLVEAVASCLAFALVWLLAPLAERWIVQVGGSEKLIVAYGFVILGNLVSESAGGILELFNHFDFQALTGTLAKILSLLIVVTVFFLEGGLWGILLAYLAANLLGTSLLLGKVWKSLRQELGTGWWRASFRHLDGQWRHAMGFVVSTNLSGTLSLITKDSDLLWLGYFRNPTEVGYYKLAQSLVTLVFIPVRPLVQTIYREVALYAANQQWDSYRQLLRKASYLATAYIVPTSIIFALLAKWLIETFYGPEFVLAVPALIILLVGVGFAQIFFWARPSLLALGHADIPMKVNILIAVLKLIGVFLLLPRFGYIGNAVLLTLLYLTGVSLLVAKTYLLIGQNSHATKTALTPAPLPTLGEGSK